MSKNGVIVMLRQEEILLNINTILQEKDKNLDLFLEEIGYNETSIKQIKNFERPIPSSILVKIAEALDVDIDRVTATKELTRLPHTIELRSKSTSRLVEKQLDAVLLAIRDYVNIIEMDGNNNAIK